MSTTSPLRTRMRIPTHAFTTTLSIFAAAMVSVGPFAAAVGLGSLFSFQWGGDGNNSDDPQRPNNSRGTLLDKYGEEGYRKLVADALGVKGKPQAGSGAKDNSVESCPYDDDETGYGVDISFPIHNVGAEVSSNYEWLPHNAIDGEISTPRKFRGVAIQPLGNRQSVYDDLIRGCRDFYGDKKHRCDENEIDRIEMNLRQPRSMQNYTELGFKKVITPAQIYNILKDFYEKNREFESVEKWPPGNTYTNHWFCPTYMVNLDNPSFPEGGPPLKRRVWQATRDMLQRWTGEELTPSSLYGIRVYKEGAVLAPHVDRLPLVTSAIINVAQDVDEPWPIEIYAHDGRAYNITMDPGDMLLYESHSVIHGRPFALKGRFYANVFVHFEPTGHTLRHEAKLKTPSAEEQYRNAKAKKAPMVASAVAFGGKKNINNDELPYYILKGSEEEMRWRQLNVGTKPKTKVSVDFSGLTAHQAAARGDLETLVEIADMDKKELTRKDYNGWQPIHEAARGGHVNVIKFLLKHGADVNARTNKGMGGTPTWWAIQKKGKNHESVKLLKEHGGVATEPAA